MSNTVTTVCYLCGLHPTGEESHIIPRFVSTRIARDCGGFSFREASNPNQVIQDTISFPLLCEKCEDRFGVWEDEFAIETYRPYFDAPAHPVILSPSTYDLMVSITWRILKYTLLEHPPTLNFSYFHEAEKSWREYLLKERKSVDPFNIYLILDDDFSDSTIKSSKALSRTHLRHTIVQGIFDIPYIGMPPILGRHVVMAKLGPFILYGSMFNMENLSNQPDSWSDLKLSITNTARVAPSELPEDLVSHLDRVSSRITEGMERLSERQKEKQTDFVKKKLPKAAVRHLVDRDQQIFGEPEP